ncbi:FAD/NAD(P)-binding domain-containing protein [Clavulina sp. PMI_390]|nr:FAD/NAD(P)-binding domain-containing protein [Clavulina sp. PMI_390]
MVLHPPRVIVIGAGIAGPVLAMFLKLHGYDPVIYERQPKIAPEGIALALQPNGLRVLEMIPGLVPKITGSIVDSFQFYSTEPSDPGLLAQSHILEDLVKGGQLRYPWFTVFRGQFHALILAEATGVYDIPIIYEHCLDQVYENPLEETVTVRFTNGVMDTASFVVGCDGLHSNTRAALFGREKANFTGMTQMGGHSPKPADPTLWRGMTNIFGNGLHFICYPTSQETIGWIITQHEGEAKETWKPMDPAGQEAVRQGLFSRLPYGAGELVRTCPQIIKYGLYDRAELRSWYRGRVVLLGDAAHPTSPHLGQGANQAFEDIYHLVRLLVKHNTIANNNALAMQHHAEQGSMPSPLSSAASTPPSSPPSAFRSSASWPFAPAPSTETLTTVFELYTTKRRARTSALTKGARVQGELRLVHGVDKCLARNTKVRNIWNNEGAMIKAYMEVWKGTFDEEPGTETDEWLSQMANHR